MKRLLLTAAMFTSPLFAAAQQGGASPDMNRALAAGWKAGFVCSATFNAGQPIDEIEANELDGIYPDFREAFAELPDPVIDHEAKVVVVDWSETLPPRLAVWRPDLGCSQLPIGSRQDLFDDLPSLSTRAESQPGSESDVSLDPGAETGHPAAVPQALTDVVEAAFDGQTFGDGNRTSGVLIASGNLILTEQYARGIDAETSQRTWSVAKSFSATVIGAAVQQGLIDVNAPAGLKAWSAPGDPRQAITVKDLMQMASGLDSGARGNRTDRLYFGGGRVIDHAVPNALEAAPGTRFKYANNDTLLMMRALREAINDDAAYLALPYDALLRKIGALRTTMETDWNGDFLSSSQVWTTARDMARLGQLYLQDGVWNGERILPEGWAEFVATPAPAQPIGRSTGYGAQFWLLNNEEGVPADAYGAFGNRGQYLIIIPSLDLLIVRRGYDVNGGGRFDPVAFTRAVVAALED